ncbi:MAG: Crp/Fnr family transcriptional regulator [Chitinophagaceae bacterium]|nr:Crp/Fnr family transcriptional regulator [Chitinophagaceae bacterium]
MSRQLLETHIQKISAINDPALMHSFTAAWDAQEADVNNVLLHIGQVSNHIYFASSGIARIYYNKHGKEITEWIAMAPGFFFSITSFFHRTPSRLGIHLIAPSKIYGIHHDILMNLASKHHSVETWFRNAMSGALILSQERMDSILFETAQQRYERLLLEQPELIQKVPLSYIASFLGITQETLSRMRAAVK